MDVADRIVASRARLAITVDGYWIGTKLQYTKDVLDRALDICEQKVS
jgi:acyl-coenzyme A synthetase/AMP-(fatty) acid ligase